MIKMKPSYEDSHVVVFANRHIKEVGNGACIHVPKEFVGKKATIHIWKD